jgi:hypothetical protein
VLLDTKKWVKLAQNSDVFKSTLEYDITVDQIVESCTGQDVLQDPVLQDKTERKKLGFQKRQDKKVFRRK